MPKTYSTLINIRQAKNSDCQQIATIYNFYLGKSTFDTAPKSATFYEMFLHNKSEREELWVITVLQKTIGWGLIQSYSPKLGYRFAGETSVYLHPQHLKAGYGSRLKRHLIKRSKELDYHYLLARIFAENEVSINYNLKMGYRIVGIQKEIGFIQEKWKDVVIMELLI